MKGSPPVLDRFCSIAFLHHIPDCTLFTLFTIPLSRVRKGYFFAFLLFLTPSPLTAKAGLPPSPLTAFSGLPPLPLWGKEGKEGKEGKKGKEGKEGKENKEGKKGIIRGKESKGYKADKEIPIKNRYHNYGILKTLAILVRYWYFKFYFVVALLLINIFLFLFL